MTLEVYLHEPKIIERAKPGMILEAIPSSSATITAFRGERIIAEPTGIFGYVIGIPTGWIRDGEMPGNYTLTDDVGRSIARRVLSAGTHGDVKSIDQWVNGNDSMRRRIEEGNEGPVLSVGYITPTSEDHGHYPLAKAKLGDGAIILSKEAEAELAKKLADYHSRREGAAFEVDLGSGKRVSVRDLNFVVKR